MQNKYSNREITFDTQLESALIYNVAKSKVNFGVQAQCEISQARPTVIFIDFILLCLLVFVEMTRETVPEREAQKEIESLERKKNKRPSAGENLSAQKMINQEESEGRIQKG